MASSCGSASSSGLDIVVLAVVSKLVGPLEDRERAEKKNPGIYLGVRVACLFLFLTQLARSGEVDPVLGMSSLG